MNPDLKKRLENISSIIWDLDNTLYPETDLLHQAFDDAIARAAILSGAAVSMDDAIRLSKQSYIDHAYGGRVFIEQYGVDPQLLHFNIHPLVNETIISAYDGLPGLFDAIAIPHALVTHGSREWALRVLNHIGLRDRFPDHTVHALEDFAFEKKHVSRRPFEQALAAICHTASLSMMVEDQARNLVLPREMGMVTVLVTHGRSLDEVPSHVDLVIDNAVELLGILKGAKSLS